MNRHFQPARRRAIVASVALFAASLLPMPAAFAQTAHKPKVALVMKSLANEFFLTMETGAKDYQKQNPDKFDLVTNGIKDETDTANQIRIVEQMIVSKVDALVIAPADSKALVPVLKKAVDAGIIVVNIDNQLDREVLKSKDLNIPFVGPDNAKGAQKVGDYLAKHLKSGDNVAIIEGVSTTTNAQQRTAGFKQSMSAGGMKVVSLQSGDWEIDKGNAVAGQILNANPDVKAHRGGIGGARGWQGRQDPGGGLRRHQRDPADARRRPRPRDGQSVRCETGRVRYRHGAEGNCRTQEAVGVVGRCRNACRSGHQVGPAQRVARSVKESRSPSLVRRCQSDVRANPNPC
jgi:ribose transport system substrate-binding protein